MAEFKLARFKHTWVGPWAVGTIYNPDDVISYGGKVYVCMVSHTANTDFYEDLNYFNDDTPPLAVPRWELVADGKSWLGDWVSDTYYKIGDIIKLGGTVYICTEAHTSATRTVVVDGETIINPLDPLGERGFAATDAGYWATQVTSNNWLADWTVNTYYKLNDFVRYNGITYKCIESHLSPNNTINGLESTQDQWAVVNISDEWKGDWTTDTKYVVRDIVRYSGIVFRCVVNHVSALSELDGLDADLSNWEELHNGSEYRNTWASATLYFVNDIVKYGSYTWKCTTFHLSSDTFALANWEEFTPGQEFDVEWNDQVVYQQGDVVMYGGDVYYALTLNSNTIPSIDTISWEPLFRSSKLIGDWKPLVNYKTGDVVARGGNLYLAIIDNVAQNPDLLNDGSTTNSEYWDLLISGIKWRGIWANGITYSNGDTVTWGANSYTCIDAHLSSQLNRPDDDSNGLYWEAIVVGNTYARLKEVGDLRTYGPDSDSTTDYKRITAGGLGDALTVNTDSESNFQPLWTTNRVYYVSLEGYDDPAAGSSVQNPWRTLRYALDRVPSYSTVFVKTGVFEEVLPMRIPAYVAVVGDELRSTVIKPAKNRYSQEYITLVTAAAEYMYDNLLENIINQSEVGTTDDTSPAFGTTLYGEILQDFTGTAGNAQGVLNANGLILEFKVRVETSGGASRSGSNDPTTNPGILDTITQLTNNKEFIKNEVTLYIENVYTDSTVTDLPIYWQTDLDRIIDAVVEDMLYPGNQHVLDAADYFVNASDYDTNKIQNMFLLRDGCGLRNCTLAGLEGELTSTVNSYGTRRVTAGAYASLDPGWGPSDTSAWVGTKSPYVQNVTTFGTGCIGLKVDGDLHAGGNQTVVSNDFTQILSDGIGIWCNGTGRTEAVSVFTYYNQISYLCTNGGKIRGTNGNSSYGTYGAVSEGFNVGETPISGVINNRYYDADVVQVFSNDEFGLEKVFFSNAGVEYTSGAFSITGSGGNGSVIMDEFRDGAVFEVRIVNRGDSSAEGGGGYVYTTNVSQGGTDKTIIISGSDENLPEVYRDMRVLIPGGTGAGQYGYVAEYDDLTKTVWVGTESKPELIAVESFSVGNILTVGSTETLAVDDAVIFRGEKFGNIQDNTVYYILSIEGQDAVTLSTTVGGVVFNLINETGSMTMHSLGWENFVEGKPLVALDTTTNYAIEPRVTFTSPGITTSSASLPDQTWTSIASNATTWVAVSSGSNQAAYGSDENSWNSSTLPASSTWVKVRYVGEIFIALSADGIAAKSTNGASWTSITMPSADIWSDVAYGNGKWVAISLGSDVTAYSTNGTTWLAGNMVTAGDYTSIAYGKGKFVAVSSTSTAEFAYSTDGISWTESNLLEPMISIAYGNNRFVAVSTGAGATTSAISFDGINWTYGTLPAANWQAVTYGQGIFVAVASGYSNCATSNQGLSWTTESIGSSNWVDVKFANISKPGKFLAISNSTSASAISTGARSQARVTVVSGRISGIRIWEPGSGYTSAPAFVITDPNNTSDVDVSVRIGNGVIGNPSIVNAGIGYETTSTRMTITGNGYKDQYHLGSFIVCDNVTRLPGPGDNLTISGINDYVYKVLSYETLSGEAGNYQLNINIAKDLGREETPEHNTAIEIRQLYSQVRLTGHDFLDIGLGNFYQTNYPYTLDPVGTVLAPEDEVRERGGGRVFYTSTDQSGNFRVGELFAVEQATGTVTLNAQFFQLQGLEELRLGGVTVGGSGVVIREFSTDSTFTADSNNIIPTQRAIGAYIQKRVSGGGADAITAALVAGVVSVGPNQISTTSGGDLIFPGLVNFKGGVDGTYLAQTFFMSSN